MSDAAPDPPACVLRLHAEAPGLSLLFFGCPVYLVGGALTDPDPRDLDVIVVLPDALFVQCYGDKGGWSADTAFLALGEWSRGTHDPDPPRIWRRWARDCAKLNAELTERCHRRVDFKVQWATHAAAVFSGKPRRVLCAGFGKHALPPEPAP